MRARPGGASPLHDRNGEPDGRRPRLASVSDLVEVWGVLVEVFGEEQVQPASPWPQWVPTAAQASATGAWRYRGLRLDGPVEEFHRAVDQLEADSCSYAYWLKAQASRARRQQGQRGPARARVQR